MSELSSQESVNPAFTVETSELTIPFKSQTEPVNFSVEEVLNAFKPLMNEISSEMENSLYEIDEISSEIKCLLNEFKERINQQSLQIDEKKVQISNLFTALKEEF